MNFIPEYYLEDIFSFYLFFIQFKKESLFSLMSNDQIHNFINCMVVLLSDAQIVKNPYIKAKQVEVFFHMFSMEKAKIFDVLSYNKAA